MKLLRLLGLSLAVALSLGVAAGCGMTGKLTGTLNANRPPETVLFVSGDVDTVNHIVHLYWFGSDSDGEVKGFEWRLLNPRAPGDTAWRFTTLTDSIFTVRADSGYADTRFSVRAVDDEGARDPEPPLQRFEFSNIAPIVKLSQKPGTNDTTFASVSVTWNAVDVDGDASKITYLVWLDGNQASPEITTATALTMPTERFKVNGAIVTGRRSLYVRAVDDGGRAGPIDSVQWNVRPAVTGTRARLLIIDDYPNNNPSNLRYDTLYVNSALRVGLSPTEFSVLRLEWTQPFRTAKDVEQTFKLFETVVWYRGADVWVLPTLQNPSQTVLSTAEEGISAYLASGGRFYLDGLYLIRGENASGALSEDFVRTHLGSRGMRTGFTDAISFRGNSIGFGNSGTSVFLPHVVVRGQVGRDSMYVNRVLQARAGEAGGLRQFDFIDREDVVLWGSRGSLTPDLGDSSAVGMSVAQPNGGRAIVVCTVPGAAQPAVGSGVSAGTAARFVTNIYRQLGLDLP